MRVFNDHMQQQEQFYAVNLLTKFPPFSQEATQIFIAIFLQFQTLITANAIFFYQLSISVMAYNTQLGEPKIGKGGNGKGTKILKFSESLAFECQVKLFL